jgi:hypothetical protein
MNFLQNRIRLLDSACQSSLFRCVLNKCSIVISGIITVFIVAAILIYSGLGCAAGDNLKQHYDYRDGQCIAAGAGELSHETLENVSSTDRSYLLSCTLSVVIGEADRTKEERDRLIQKKQKLSDAILSKSIDIEFVGHEGNHLLNDVVLSFFPEQWKLETLKKLIDMGVDLDHRNKHGKRALDLARFRGQNKIAKFLAATRR